MSIVVAQLQAPALELIPGVGSDTLILLVVKVYLNFTLTTYTLYYTLTVERKRYVVQYILDIHYLW
jgi:hypothetical protein